MAKWIWKFGDFERYHGLKLHERRTEFGDWMPVVWKLYPSEPIVQFTKRVTTQGGTFRLRTTGRSVVQIFGLPDRVPTYGENTAEIPLPAGTMEVRIRVINYQSFPSIYVDGIIESDESWVADDTTIERNPVGCWDVLNDIEQTPEEFPFVYEPLQWVSKEIVDGGVLFDFGKETFCKLSVSGLTGACATVRFGESKPEALDPVNCIVRFDRQKTENGKLELPTSAFRYVWVDDPAAVVQAEYEYLPLSYKGAFECGEEVVDWVWKTAAYTFHLNTREFFLDGIKRDRWVWSGDAYQSQFVNHYLFFDKEVEKRTLILLGGGLPFKQHMNTIMDYTFYWVMGVYDYYKTFGDLDFVRQIYPQVRAVMEFCLNRRDPDGYMRGKPGDWIFIDWADMDKTGALLGEQVLFARALQYYADICSLVGEDGSTYAADAANLQQQIIRQYYMPEQGAFMDSFESGAKNITRHNNILAYLFLPCTQEQKEAIYKNVLCNDAVPPITTPYFKFYENMAYCEAGDMKSLERCMREYYGAMKALGATSLYEQFDPTQEGDEHLAMYGMKFGKSLCHAWSASPIYLLGRYRMGVENTGVAYDTFRVKPMLGDLPPFTGTVPVPGGEVRVSVSETEVEVLATIPGGTLEVAGATYPLEAGVSKKVSYRI
ncbi:MAG: alpha-rhamnosidase [Clostridia bacterium]|nr:alpha-rhamnosidase [Clostridia bacterium]